MVLGSILWPENIKDIGAQFSNPFFLVDFILTLIIVIASLIFICRFIKSKSMRIFYSIASVVLVASFIFRLYLLLVLMGVLLVCVTVAVMVLTGNEVRSVLRDEFHFSGIFATKKNKKEKVSNLQLCDELETAVVAMSHEKCGALITIECEDRITTDHFSRWSDLDADPTNELLRTIFYKGTPLHDGATIIREGKIIRSGVIFDSVSVSNKAMPGFLGSRHRAALGITETYDCVSITVSEETGSIHLYYNGHIEKCFAANFKEKLMEVLKTEASEEEKKN